MPVQSVRRCCSKNQMEEKKLNNNLKEILSHFDVDTKIEPYGNGHINDTYLCDSNPGFILQRINTNVFKKPDEVMKNIAAVTAHLRKKIEKNGGDPDRETLNVIPTKDGNAMYRADSDNYYRMYKFIDNTIGYDVVENPIQLRHAGSAFGKFQRMLDDFNVEDLFETIPNFHYTPDRVEQLKSAVEKNFANRKETAKPELETAMKYSKFASAIVDAMDAGDVPRRVTHNDTKLNNVLFDKTTDDAICVIDLDTVMGGSMLYDYGDALRFGASSAAEDETDLSKVYFDLEKFEEFTCGFLGEVADCMTEKETELLPLSVLILTYECAIRFLADYLNGDVYFKIHRENHNLDRARTQLKLVEDIEAKLEDMAEIVKKYLK